MPVGNWSTESYRIREEREVDNDWTERLAATASVTHGTVLPATLTTRHFAWSIQAPQDSAIAPRSCMAAVVAPVVLCLERSCR